jgi:Met-zincin/Domain of unknown function (DUF5117)
MRIVGCLLTALILAGCAARPGAPDSAGPADGFIPLQVEPSTERVLLDLPPDGSEFLYLVSLPRGLGSNDLGLDRGQLGAERILRVERHGDRVLLVEPNLRYRAVGAADAEARAVRESFAESVVWAFELEREVAGRLRVDATDFVMRDIYGIGRRLEDLEQGSLALDRERSVLFRPRTRAFPDSTEIEVRLTFVGRGTGEYLESVAPDPDAVTLHLRHSFIRLPGPGYRPLAFDPRAGAAAFYTDPFLDYAAPLAAPMRQQFVARHRLQRTDPTTATSTAVEPIVYYLDPGTPEPVRSALLDGAGWWAQAFAAAGYEDAFRVEMLPEDADPMDVRYNVIQWVHRSTRGWSYGDTVVDPRTGEIIKGHVSLGSLRVRQDLLIALGLTSPFVDDATDGAVDDAAVTEPMVELALALARLRQLAAHEVGHTLGFAHNYVASTIGRASVMDYPHPWVTLGADGVDLSQAYAEGIGDWDRVAVRWMYSDLGDAATDARERILREAWESGLYQLSDEVARPPGGAHPTAHLWDNGDDPTAELDRLLALRADALARMGANSIPIGAPMAQIEEVLVPIYLMHRYQVEAVVKQIAGLDYRYQMRGDGQPGPTPVPPETQRRAIAAMFGTLTPVVLRMPPELVASIPPRPPGYPDSTETFPSRRGPVFDPLAAAEVAADLSLSLLLQPERASRLADQSVSVPGAPDLDEVLRGLVDLTWSGLYADGGDGELRRMVADHTVDALRRLAVDDAASGAARAAAWAALERLATSSALRAETSFARYQRARIAAFLDDPARYPPPDPLTAPAGSPIGTLLGDAACGWKPRGSWLVPR